MRVRGVLARAIMRIGRPVRVLRGVDGARRRILRGRLLLIPLLLRLLLIALLLGLLLALLVLLRVGTCTQKKRKDQSAGKA